MSVSYQKIIKEVQQGKFEPIYFLAGMETFFIDEIEKAIIKHAFPTGGKEFNLDIVYGRDIGDINEVLSICQQYPSFAERRVVVVREAQYLNRKEKWNPLVSYLKQPMPSTVLLVLYKSKSLDKRWSVYKSLKAASVYHEFEKLKEHAVVPWVRSWVGTFGLQIDEQNAMLIVDNIGADLSRLANEINKLVLVLPKGAVVDAVAIEKYIGISREFNTFELSDAMKKNDLAKAVKIIDYFVKNPKSGPMPFVIGVIYQFYSKLWLYYNIPDHMRNNRSYLSKTLGYYHVEDSINAAKFYTPERAEKAISLLAEYDMRSKGVGSKSIGEHELMLELIYKLMT